MNRDEFMELVYETFADEPDNVLANGIIEAADAYVEQEKTQFFSEGTTSVQPVATDTNVGDKISKFIDGLEEIFADLRERHVDDSVCGLCEYDGAYMGQSGDWCNECPGFDRDDCFKLSDKTRKEWTDEIIKALPTIQPERQKGEWIDYTEDGYVECPFCHSATNCDGNKDELHFCFSCGADMRGEQDG